ncbi:MAG: GNAT family N-acetyltransferase [Pyrinomonadaceae bacterium]
MLKNFMPFPVLKTERLILRQIEADDAAVVFDLRTNKTVNKFLLRTSPETIENVLRTIEKLNQGISAGNNIYWVLNLENDRKVIGTICLWNLDAEKSVGEIGYEIHPDFQGKGLMREAVKRVLKYGFEEMKLEKIEAWTNTANSASIRLLERNNFVRNLEAETAIDREKEGEDTVIYVLEKETFYSNGK